MLHSQIVSLPREKAVILLFVRVIVFCCVPSTEISAQDTKTRGQEFHLQEDSHILETGY